MSEQQQQLLLAPVEAVLEFELVDATIAEDPTDVVALGAPAPAGMETRNRFGEAQRIAARAASASTLRQYASIVRAFGDWLARDLGREDQIEGVRIPRHEPGPPETLTDNDYANLLRVPDRRTLAGKRDYAVLRVLGDCGLRSAELRGLRAPDLRRPRSNARHYRLFVLGKGGREREVPVPLAVQAALEAWTAVHPLARGVALLDEQTLFVRLGRHGHE